MGNNLCKERIARAENSKSPIDRIIGRCAQICPANEVKSNHWQKHVLETGPPTRTQPQSLNDGWRKVTLTVPNGKNSDEIILDEMPVVPPRRKRSSVIDRQPCGFKELFGNNVSRRSSCDSILKDDYPLNEHEQEILQQKRKSKSISDFNLNETTPTNSLKISTIRIPVTRTLSLMERSMVQQQMTQMPRPLLQRKISRVGNRKSDKFFGENLSDCLSDDPITPEPEQTSISFTYHTVSTLITPISHDKINEKKDKLDEFIDSNLSKIERKPQDKIDGNDITISSPKPFIIGDRIDSKQIIDVDKKCNLDKKAEFLMAMLEGNNNSSKSMNNEPKSPPRRSYLKKMNSQFEVTNKTNQNDFIEKKMITDNNANNIQMKTAIDDDEEYYKGMIPVNEPLIVPKERPTKHICDNDDYYIYKHTEKNHDATKENKVNGTKAHMNDADIEKYIIMRVSNSPEKPKRDLNLYEKLNKGISTNLNNSTISFDEKADKIIENSNESMSKSIPRVRHLSQENLLSKKILPTKSNDTIDLMRIKSMQNKNKNPNSNDKLLEKFLKRYTSQQSFFPPNSKLSTRKISAHRKESNVSRPILENDFEVKFIETVPKIIEMEHKATKSISNKNNLNRQKTMNDNNNNVTNEKHSTSIDRKILRHTEDFLNIERKISEKCNGINRILNAQESTKKNSTTLDENNAKNLNNITLIHSIENCDKSENENNSDDENTDSDITVKEVPVNKRTDKKVENNIQLQMNNAKEKRDDIVEVDASFLKHNNNLSNLPRRGSETYFGYDTRKVYPFGKADPDDGTAFFETKPLSKSAENILNENVCIVEQNNSLNENPSTTEHSILLKYLK